MNNAFNVVSGKEYDKEGDAYGNGSTLHARTDRGRPEKIPKSPGERGGEVAEFLVNDIKKAMRQGCTLRDIRDLLADAGVSVPLTKLRALFDKASDLEPIKEQDGAEKDTPSPHKGNSNGEWGSADGI